LACGHLATLYSEEECKRRRCAAPSVSLLALPAPKQGPNVMLLFYCLFIVFYYCSAPKLRPNVMFCNSNAKASVVRLPKCCQCQQREEA
jgi:hypothetical protein